MLSSRTLLTRNHARKTWDEAKESLKAKAKAGNSLHRLRALLSKGLQEGTTLVALEAARVTQARPWWGEKNISSSSSFPLFSPILPSLLFPLPFGLQRKPRQTLTALSHQRELRLKCSKWDFVYLKKKLSKNLHLGGRRGIQNLEDSCVWDILRISITNIYFHQVTWFLKMLSNQWT